ncbi:DUF2332 family protein [Sphingomonas suaedae]|uniref:DUF2332 family protein n=1 Tax=Sphingomonas suaedae TaxID=2599297 RepID=A0A518RGQ3_9SPHN|nr:DUF2332 family protein [Sphingomonas suaedae]QDX26638.1 DUF2332 family protein [Sphingomonas suaedae]
MNMMAQVGTRGELRRQSRIARALGSPFVAAVLEAGDRQLHHAPQTCRLIEGWPDDPSAAALAMRFNAALHALARRGDVPALSALYQRAQGDFDAVLAQTLAAQDGFIVRWMQTPTQTNEVARAAAFAAALIVLRRETGMAAELLEIGSSCGLNLNLARYAYDLGGTPAGDWDSPVRIRPEWRGRAPHIAPVEVVGARGVDLNPLEAGDARARARLIAFVWADQPRRIERLKAALRLARAYPPRVDRADATLWLPERLAEPQAAGVCRVVFHSMVLQYLGAVNRQAVVDAIDSAGARATADRPLARISFEWTPARDEVQLVLTRWPAGERRVLAICHPYGDWIDWRA